MPSRGCVQVCINNARVVHSIPLIRSEYRGLGWARVPAPSDMSPRTVFMAAYSDVRQLVFMKNEGILLVDLEVLGSVYE